MKMTYAEILPEGTELTDEQQELVHIFIRDLARHILDGCNETAGAALFQSLPDEIKVGIILSGQVSALDSVLSLQGRPVRRGLVNAIGKLLIQTRDQK